MSDIIDLSERRNAKDRPDDEWVRHDDFGRPLYHYGLSYRFEGGNSHRPASTRCGRA